MDRMNRIEEAPEAYDLSGQVIGLAMKVHSTLGPGFLESVYQNALIWELRKSGFKSEAERPISVYYDGQTVGAFTADVLVNGSLIVELKASQSLAKAHEVQLVTISSQRDSAKVCF
jgi:GxxExxY protein